MELFEQEEVGIRGVDDGRKCGERRGRGGYEGEQILCRVFVVKSVVMCYKENRGGILVVCFG